MSRGQGQGPGFSCECSGPGRAGAALNYEKFRVDVRGGAWRARGSVRRCSRGQGRAAEQRAGWRRTGGVDRAGTAAGEGAREDP